MDLKSRISNIFKSSPPQLPDSKVFCMAPWVTLLARPSGEVFPCCLSHYDQPVADLKTSSLIEAWNSPDMRELRMNMLNGKESKICTKCYQQESLGYSHSPRKEFNRNYAHLFKRTSNTQADGHLKKMDLAYLDIRFSNMCNFKCRSCGPSSSSSHGPLLKNIGIFEELKPHLQSLETAYFAGGEPLIMKEHYQVLEWLIENKQTDVQLNYSTNFSKYKFQKWNVFELWKHFEKVTVVASIDGSGAKGSYIRPGLNWEQLLSNHELMVNSVPHIDFYVNTTLSVLNAYHVIDFHKEIVKRGLITSKERMFLNPLFEPEYLRPDIFPQAMKQELLNLYTDHINGFCSDWVFHGASNRNDWIAARNLIQQKDFSDWTPEFNRKIRQMDESGHGIASEIFPELAPLFNCADQLFLNHPK